MNVRQKFFASADEAEGLKPVTENPMLKEHVAEMAQNKKGYFVANVGGGGRTVGVEPGNRFGLPLAGGSCDGTSVGNGQIQGLNFIRRFTKKRRLLRASLLSCRGIFFLTRNTGTGDNKICTIVSVF